MTGRYEGPGVMRCPSCYQAWDVQSRREGLAVLVQHILADHSIEPQPRWALSRAAAAVVASRARE